MNRNAVNDTNGLRSDLLLGFSREDRREGSIMQKEIIMEKKQNEAA